MGRLLGGDHWYSVAIFGGKTTKHVKHDVAQGVHEALELAGVGCDVHVALHECAELHFKVHHAMEFVVTELFMDLVPDGVHGRLLGAHDSADIFGDGVVEPSKDALIDHDLVRITTFGRSGGVSDVGGETEFADDGIEEAPPFNIIPEDQARPEHDGVCSRFEERWWVGWPRRCLCRRHRRLRMWRRRHRPRRHHRTED